jgi:hypothetical protein
MRLEQANVNLPRGRSQHAVGRREHQYHGAGGRGYEHQHELAWSAHARRRPEEEGCGGPQVECKHHVHLESAHPHDHVCYFHHPHVDDDSRDGGFTPLQVSHPNGQRSTFSEDLEHFRSDACVASRT